MNPSHRVSDQDALRVARFLAGCEAAGAEPPAALRKALATEETLFAWLTETRQARAAIRTGEAVAGVVELLAAAAKGERPTGFAKALDEAEARSRRLELEESLLITAHDEAAVDVRSEMHNDVLIVDVLRPVHDAILGRVRELAPASAGTDPDDAEAVLAASPKVQQTRSELLSLHERFRAVRDGWRALVQHGPEDSDHDTFRHPERAPRTVKPPTGRLAYLLWLAGTDAEAWLPTHAERKAAQREAREEAKKGRMSTSDVRAVLGAG